MFIQTYFGVAQTYFGVGVALCTSASLALYQTEEKSVQPKVNSLRFIYLHTREYMMQRFFDPGTKNI